MNIVEEIQEKRHGLVDPIYMQCEGNFPYGWGKESFFQRHQQNMK